MKGRIAEVALLFEFQGTKSRCSARLLNELDYLTILPFIAGAAIRGLPVKIVFATTNKSRAKAHVARPEIDSIKALKGKRIAINSFGSSADFAITNCLGRNGLIPTRYYPSRRSAGSPTPFCRAARGLR
jgi:hypothetical protein